MQRKIISILLTAAVIMITAPTVFADGLQNDKSSTSSFQISEYDIISENRTADEASLIAEGFSADEIAYFRSDAVENALLRRAAMSETELAATYGYTEEQIDVLKSYNGERIESSPQLKGVLGACSGKVTCPSASASRMKVRLTWEWTSAPVLNGNAVYDIVAVRWKGTDSSGSPLNIALNSSQSLSYCKLNTINSGKIKTHTYKLTVNDAYESAYKKFSMEPNSGSGYWAKSGELQITLDTTGSKKINEIATCFSYGHSVLTTSPGISFPTGFSISFKGGVDKMFSYTNRITSAGKITSY